MVKLIKLKKNPKCVYREREKEREQERKNREKKRVFFLVKKRTVQKCGLIYACYCEYEWEVT